MNDEMVPDDHFVMGGPGGSYRGDVSVEPTDDGRRVYVSGLAPPEYSPIVTPLGNGRYHVERPHQENARVSIQKRRCECWERQRGEWCPHLQAAMLVHTRDWSPRDTRPDGDDHPTNGR